MIIRNDRIEIAFARDGNTLLGQCMKNRATGFDWIAPGTIIGPYLSQGGMTYAGCDAASDLTLTRQHQLKTGPTSDALLTTWTRADGLELEWSLTRFPDVSVVEYRVLLRNTGSKPVTALTSLGPLIVHLRGEADRFNVHWVTRSDYRKHEAVLDDAFTLRGGTWNRPDAAGWLALEHVDAHEILFLGFEWESYWRMSLERQRAQLVLQCALEGFTRDLPPQDIMTSPRLFLGISHGNIDDALRDFHDYLRTNVMSPQLPHCPWVTYDIWGTEAQGVEESILAEIPHAADLGVEVFYIDASWYEGSCKNGSGDWFTAVGNWHSEDRIKYPHGLASLSRQVHEAGMKFGLWFCPQMCDASLIGQNVPEAWVARCDGKDITLNLGNGWATITQLCLGNPEVVQSLKTALSAAVEQYRLDWLKWDDSGFPGQVCNRTDHGHGAHEGALAALTGKYMIWADLHERYPDLVLENCGYPARLDYGLARYARAHWLSDDTSNALRCRQSQIHGSYVMPSAYNTAWIVKSDELDQQDPEILDSLIRSRMIGLFGMGTLLGTLPERVSLFPRVVKDALSRNINHYKQYRHLLHADVYHVLPPSTGPGQWDAIQFCTRDGSESVLLVFRGTSPRSDQVIVLRGLTPDASYRLTSLNSGHSEWVPAATVIVEGLNVSLPKADTSEIYLLTR